MKTLVILLSFITTLAGIPLNAQNSFAALDNTPQIFAQIQKQMRVPQNMKNTVSTEKIRVVFTIDEKGKAHVVEVNTNRPDLKSSVISQFEAIDFTDAKNTDNQQYSIWLTFKVL